MLGLPIKQNLCHFSTSLDTQHFIEFIPTVQLIPYICSIWKILHFYSSFPLNPSKSTFFHVLTLFLLPKNHILFIVSKQCACSRWVHIDGHMNRFKFLLSWTIIPIVIVLGLFCQKIISFAASLCVNLHFMKVSTENDNNFRYEKIKILVDNMPLSCCFSLLKTVERKLAEI